MIECLSVGPLGVNCYVLSSASRTIIVDPGDEASMIFDYHKCNNLTPSLIVLTHGHLDHLAAVPKLRMLCEKSGIAIPVAAHSGDADYFGERSQATHKAFFDRIGASFFFDAYWVQYVDVDIVLEDSMMLPGTSWQVVHTPGHSPGSICLYSREENTLISGDTLFRASIGACNGVDSNLDVLRASLEKIVSFPGETKLLPGHYSASTIAQERPRVLALAK